MALDPLLVSILVCPVDRGPLWYFEDEELLYNPRSKTVYAITDGIPVLLPDEGRQVDEDEAQRLEAKESSALVTGSAPKHD
jgi:uncharacterized protein YbaR (Trm112 family)